MSDPASIAPLSSTPKWCIAVTILAAAVLYLLGNGSVSLWDRDEPRYAQCSRQMLNGFPGPEGHGPDFVVPRFLNHLRTEKPPLIYWLQAGSMRLFGDNAFAARFPSSLAMVGSLTLLAFMVYRLLDPVRAAWAVFIMASSALTILSAKMCLTDSVLLLWDTIALFCTFAVYRGNRSWIVTFILWGALGVGGLTKGPIVLAVVGATLIVLAIIDFLNSSSVAANIPATVVPRKGIVLEYAPPQRLSFGERLRRAFGWMLALRPLVGILILAAINGPWLYLVHHREPMFLKLILGRAADHFASATEKHAAPPGFYVAAIWGLLFPWSILLPLTIAFAWRHRQSPILRFALAVTIGVWIFQECMKAKLPFYVLPTFPWLAILTADAIVRCLRGEYNDLTRKGFMIPVAIWAVAVLAMGAAPWLLTMPSLRLGGLLPIAAMIGLSLAAVIYVAVVVGLFKSSRTSRGLMAMGVGSMVIFGLIFTAFLPHAAFLQLSQRVAAALKANGANDVKMIEYKEPSLAYYQGGTIVEERLTHYFDHVPPEEWPMWAVLPKSIWDHTRPEAKALLEQIGPARRGIDYAGKVDNQRIVDVVIVRKR